MASSGNTATSHPAASAASYASRIRSTFPSRSPTLVLSWHRPTRTLGIRPGYPAPRTGQTVAMAKVAAAVDAEALVRDASLSLGRLLDTDKAARHVLVDLDSRAELAATTDDELARWKGHELLRIAARDLLGLDALETIAAALATMASDTLAAAVQLAGAPHLAVIGMGKLGGRELNYSSDVDILFVGDGDAAELEGAARAVVAIARHCFRVDLNLRPEGRNGALVRSVESYEAYWDRWAEPWEFQALLKARFVAGDSSLGKRFTTSAAAHLWARPFNAESIRSVRAMKARAEADVARRG